MRSLSPELHQHIWAALVGEAQAAALRSPDTSLGWPHWERLHRRRLLEHLWAPGSRPPRGLSLDGLDALSLGAWDQWWPTQGGWTALPPSACALKRVVNGQLVLCRARGTLWVGCVRGFERYETRRGCLRKVGLGSWSLLQVDAAPPRWWRGAVCCGCEWSALPRAISGWLGRPRRALRTPPAPADGTQRPT